MSISSGLHTHGLIAAGPASSLQTFSVPRSALQKSPVIKGWIEDRTTIPLSLIQNDALHFPNVDAEVVKTLIRYLETEDKDERDWFEFEFEFGQGGKEKRGPVFFVRMYKLALSLALDELCVSALSKIQNRKYDVETFIDLAVEIEGGKLIEGKRFREWIVKYITQSSDALLEAKHLKTVIQDGGHRAWAICSLMVSALSYQNVDSVTREVKEVKVERSERSTLLSPPLSITKRKTSETAAKSVTVSSTTYSKTFKATSGVNSRIQAGMSKKRNLNVTIEDAPPSEDEEDSVKDTASPTKKATKKRRH